MDAVRGPVVRGAGGTGVVGRRGEQLAIDSFLDTAAPRAFRVLHLSGPAGIGKTTLWLAAVTRARELGWRVLLSRPTESERALSFSGLIDLFESVPDEAVAALPEPQRVAVDAALLRATPDQPPQPLAVSIGVLGLIRALTADGPLLLAIDDVQWLDTSTSRTLEFALRRLDEDRVAVVVAEREGEGPAPSGLVAAVPAERRSRIAVSPVGIDDVGQLIESSLSIELRRPVLLRLHALSGGNPFFALELARAIGGADSPTDAHPVVLPASPH